MAPLLAMHDLADCLPAKAVFTSHIGLASRAVFIVSPNLLYVLLRQAGIVAVFAARRIVRSRPPGASLADFVRCIRGVCSEKEMVWPDTGSVVAVMADNQTVRDRPEMEFPREAMRYNRSSFDKHLPVAMFAVGAKVPTSSRLLHAAPEPLFRRAIAQCVRAFTAAKARPASAIMARIRVIFRAAFETVGGHTASSFHSRNLTHVTYQQQGWVT